MLKKCVFYCFASMLVVSVLGTPGYAGMTFDRTPIAHTWPNISGVTREVSTYVDPNSPTGGSESGGDQRVQEHFNNGRAMTQTFSCGPGVIGGRAGVTPVVVDGNGGYTLTNVVITEGGADGSSENVFSVHLFDINVTGEPVDEQPWPNTTSYTPSDNAWPYGPLYDWFSTACTFIFPEDENEPPIDYFLLFGFTEYDRADIEPNHMYAFEIWGPQAAAAHMYWIRDVKENLNYTAGRAYECAGDKDGPGPGIGPADLSASRTQITSGSRDMTLGVYGVLADGNAFHPEPRNYEPEASVSPTLKWHPGQWADDVQGHQVWFGTSSTKVRNRDSSTNMGRFDACEFTPTGPLAFNKMYYWMVDEYNDCCSCPHLPPCHSDGNCYWGVPTAVPTQYLWRFTTVGPYARVPQPATGTTAEFTIKNMKLTWTVGSSVQDINGHRVYFGTSFAEVDGADTSTPKIYRGAVTDPCYPLIKLLEDVNGDGGPDYTLTNGTYYWRVDEVNDGATGSPWKGPTWNFIMPLYVGLDNFAYGTQAAMDEVWKTGVKKATCLPDGGGLIPGGQAVLSGGRMRFSYNNGNDPANYLPFSEAKMDNQGVGVDWTGGGLVNLQSISVSIDGNNFNGIDPEYDNLYMAIEDTAGNIGIVYCPDEILQARAWSTNISRPQSQWNVSLDDLNNGTPGTVNLTDINALYIGLGSRCDWGSRPYGPYGGTGTIAIDNVQLYMPRCLADYEGYKGSEGDFAGDGFAGGNWKVGDCDVDYYDLDYFASDWLKGDVTLSYSGVTPPLASRLIVWYDFNEISGRIAHDKSGHARDANVGGGDANWPWNDPVVWDTTGGRDGNGCINFEPGFREWVDIPTSAYDPDSNGVTFSFWAITQIDWKFDGSGYYDAQWPSVFTFHSSAPCDSGCDSQMIESQTPTTWPPVSEGGPKVRFVDMRAGGGPDATPASPQKFSDFAFRWHHFAYTYDDINRVKEVWMNGQLAAKVDSNFADSNVPLPLWPAPGSFRLATRRNAVNNSGGWGYWYGKLDDFRVYNYRLKEKEIQYLATDGTGTRTYPLVEPTNLKSSSPERVNFADYAILMSKWLKEDLWP